jgi:hypothetical protein
LQRLDWPDGVGGDGAGAHFHGFSLFGVARKMFNWTPQTPLKNGLSPAISLFEACFPEVGIRRFVESQLPSALLEIS